MDLRLAEMGKLKNCPIEYVGNENILEQPVSQVFIDSRQVQPASLFVAIRGERLDGHQFLAEAFEKGALAALVDQAYFNTQGKIIVGNFFVVPDTIFALQQLANYYRQKFSIPFVAITGTSGKTTTKEMIEAVLSFKYNVLKTSGNLNNHIGVPLTLFQLNQKHQIALIEMGTNHFGEIKRLTEIAQPDCGLITNIGRGHLEFFGSLEGVARAKRELFEGLPPDGTAFINADDPLLMKNIPPIKRLVFYGIKNEAQIKGEFLGMLPTGETRFKVFNQEIVLQVPGMHHVYNALAAISVGLEFDINVEQIKPLLEQFKPHSKRMEIIRQNEITILNDCYNANPDSTMAALSTLKQMSVPGRKIAVLADMLELGDTAETEHREIGQQAPQMELDFLLGYGPLTRVLVQAAQKSKGIHAIHFDDKIELTDYLVSLLKPGDLVLIKGSRGMAMETVLEAIIN